VDGRIVITFRVGGGPGRGFLERARALRGRVESIGGVLVALDGTKVSFALEDPSLEKTIRLVTSTGADTSGDETPWAVGIAQGSLEPFGGETGAGGSTLAWGPSLVAASLLAAKARPSEILCAEKVGALRAGQIVTMGTRIARDGELRVRGARIDRSAPFRKQTIERLARMRIAPLVSGTKSQLRATAGAVTVWSPFSAPIRAWAARAFSRRPQRARHARCSCRLRARASSRSARSVVRSRGRSRASSLRS
jgi:hypothetical protein